MENASKALIMAAGVLIGVLIISLAAYLFFNFASTSSRLHEQIEQDRINQFNTQFISYEEKDNLTFYDILTVVNLVKDNNQNYDLENSEEGNYYITVSTTNTENNKTNLQKLSEDELNELLRKDIEKQDDGILPNYTCKVEISTLTQLVKKVTFTKK